MMLNNFSKESDGRKLIISIDDIDISLQRELFNAIFNDLKNKITPNVMIIVASSNHQIESSELINLANFDDNEVRKFVTANFGNVDQDIIYDIISKSQGYPASLAWLWHNYTQNEDIGQLLTRFSREGFIQELQKNFFDRLFLSLSKEEQYILKICAVLESPDTLLISELAGVDIGVADKILDNLSSRGILEIISSLPLFDGRTTNFYDMYTTFKSAMRSIYGSGREINERAVKFYSNSLFKNIYPNSLTLVGLMLEDYSNSLGFIKSQINPDQFVNLLNMQDAEQEAVICFVVINYYLARQGESAFGVIKSFAKTISIIADKIENQNLKSAWKHASEFILLFPDLIGNEDKKNKAIDHLNGIESSLTNESPGISKMSLMIIYKLFRGVLLAESLDKKGYLDLVLESYAASAGILSLDKVSKISLLVTMGDSSLQAGNYDFPILTLSQALEEFNSLTEKEKMEYRRRLEQKPLSFSLMDVKSSIEYDLGIANLLMYEAMLAKSSRLDDGYNEILRSSLDQAVKYLSSAKSDPIKGKFYNDAKSLFDQYGAIDKGLELIENERYEEALSFFDNQLKSNLDDEVAWNNKGITLEKMNRYTEALEAFDAAIRINSNDALYWYNKGRILVLLDKTSEALQPLDTAISLEENYREVWHLKGLILHELKQYREAINCYDKAIEIDPDNADNVNAYLDKAQTLDDLKIYDEELKCIEKAMEIDSGNADVWNAKAWFLAKTDKNNEALPIIEKALEISPNISSALDTKGFILANLGKYEEAIIYYDQAIELDSNNPDCWQRKGLALGKLGKEDEAKKCFDRAEQLRSEV